MTDDAPPTRELNSISIEGVEYIYTIVKDEKENKIIIKLTEEKPYKNISYLYKASPEKLAKDIKQLSICDNNDQMITSLQDIFNKGKICVEKKDEKYIMKIKINAFGITSIYEIELEKNDPHDENKKILNKIKEIDDKYKEIKEEINNIKINNSNAIIYNEEERNRIIKEIKNELNIKEIVKELLIKDKDIKNILNKEFENKLNDYKNEETKNMEESVNKIINEKYSNNMDIEIYNDNINKIKENINNQIKEINNIKNDFMENIKKEFNEYNKTNNKNNILINNLYKEIDILNNKIIDNYITIKIEIKKDDIGKDIIILNQCWTYKLFKNFELEDIIININGENIPIKYKHNNYSQKCVEYKDKPEDLENSRKIYKELNNNYSFYWNFDNEGIYDIKIIFNKKLCSCSGLFYKCSNIIQADLSKFNCENITSCYGMFYCCKNLKKIDFGKLNFSLVTDFSIMFSDCDNLIDLDISNFNTKNSKSFCYMFQNCINLKKINVSTFNSSKCETINGMFYGCESITEIDMINWDMSNLKYDNDYKQNPIDYLFSKCSNIKKIKISGNLKKEEVNNDFEGYIFYGIPQNGDLIKSKNVECNFPLDRYLPKNWSINSE